MDCKIFRVPFTFKKNGKEITRYNFYVLTREGAILRIDYNHGTEETDYKYDNYRELCLVATKVDSREDILNYYKRVVLGIVG